MAACTLSHLIVYLLVCTPYIFYLYLDQRTLTYFNIVAFGRVIVNVFRLRREHCNRNESRYYNSDRMYMTIYKITYISKRAKKYRR